MALNTRNNTRERALRTLEKGAAESVAQIKSNIENKNPVGDGTMKNTGAAAGSLQYRVVDTNHVQVISVMDGTNYIMTLEHGRGPTKTSTASTPTLQTRIETWVEQRGITPGDISQSSLAYLITRKIHREGTKLYRKGGNSGIISEVQTESWIMEHFTKPYETALAEEIRRETRKLTGK